MRHTTIRILAACALAFAALSAHATRSFSGTFSSGASYAIAVPDGWQPGGPLVLYQHGFSFDDPGPTTDLGPLRDVMLSEGYAIAASSFSQRGWALFDALDDNRDLLDKFKNIVGEPGEIVPFGGSMGGLIALKLAEQPDFQPIKGVVAACPAVAGARLWDQALDIRLAYDAICAGAGELPTGDAPLPWALNLDDIPRNLDNLEDDVRVLQALVPVAQCTGLGLPDYLRNGAMDRRRAELEAFTGITDEHFLATNIAYATFALSDLVRAPDKLGGRNPFTTIGVDYGASLDAAIPRFAADPLAALELHAVSDFRGHVGAAKILSLQTSKDQLVIPGNQGLLRALVPPSQLVSAIVDEASPTHCGFKDAEGLAGWEALRAWKDGGPQPTVSDLQQRCLAYVALGAGGPCRFDPNATFASFDSVVRPRPAATGAQVDRRFSGQWYDPTRNGEGFDIEVLNDTQALVFFYTYPPASVAGTQTFLYGVGTLVDGGIAVDPVAWPTSRVNGVREQERWGTFFISFDDCTHGRARWEGPPAWGARDVALTRLVGIDGLGCGAPTTATTPDAWSGSWFDPADVGAGFTFEHYDADHLAAIWYTYAANGSPAWYTAVLTRSGGDFTGPLAYSVGTHFGDAFDEHQIVQSGIGTLTVTPQCPNVRATVALTGGATSVDTLARLTVPLGVSGGCPQ